VRAESGFEKRTRKSRWTRENFMSRRTKQA